MKDRPLPIIPKLPLALPSSPQSRLEERSSVTPLPPLPPIHDVPEESGPGVFLTQVKFAECGDLLFDNARTTSLMKRVAKEV